MHFVDNNHTNDPRVNLAIEEHLLRNWDTAGPILLFYINEPAVIIGRNQNTLEEIDPDFVRERGIHVVRRLSGGGAVYHDLGNLNFSFITPDKKGLHKFARILTLTILGTPILTRILAADVRYSFPHLRDCFPVLIH